MSYIFTVVKDLDLREKRKIDGCCNLERSRRKLFFRERIRIKFNLS
jgi:hypothetical protein